MRRFFKTGVQKSWFLSYLLTVCIMMLVFFVTFSSAGQVLNKNVERFNGFVMKYVCGEFDRALNSAVNFNIDIGTMDEIREAAQRKMEGTDKSRYFEFERIKKLLVRMQYMNSNIKDVWIYFENSHMVAGMSGIMLEESFEKYIFEGFFDEVGNITNSKFYILDSETEGKMVFCVTSTQNAVVVSKLNMEKPFDTVKNLSFTSEGYVYISDSKNNLFYDGTNAGSEEIGEMAREGGRKIRYGGVKYVVSKIESALSGWNYIFVIPESVWTAESIKFAITLIIGAIFAFVVGNLVSLYLTRKNYVPFKELIGTYEKMTGYRYENEEEFLYFKNIIKKAIDDKENLQMSVRKSEKDALKHDIIYCLKGYGETERLRKNSFFEAGKIFFVCCIGLRNVEQLFVDDDISPMRRHAYAEFICENILEDILNVRNNCYIVRLDNYIVVITSSEDESVKEFIEDGIREAYDIISQTFEFKFITAISRPCVRTEELSEVYSEGREILKKSFMLDSGEIIDCTKTGVESEGRYIYTTQTENKLMNVVKGGDETGAAEFIQAILKNKELTNVQIKHAIHCIMGTMYKLVYEAELTSEESIEITDSIDRISEASDINFIISEICSVCAEICRVYLSKNKKGNKHVWKIAAYIDENYADQALNVDMIGRFFDMKASYLTKLFNDYFGISILKYIHTVRIERAKSLIDEGKYNLDEIAEKVGFTNARTFRRVFVSLEGIPPSEYKNRLG